MRRTALLLSLAVLLGACGGETVVVVVTGAPGTLVDVAPADIPSADTPESPDPAPSPDPTDADVADDVTEPTVAETTPTFVVTQPTVVAAPAVIRAESATLPHGNLFFGIDFYYGRYHLGDAERGLALGSAEDEGDPHSPFALWWDIRGSFAIAEEEAPSLDGCLSGEASVVPDPPAPLNSFALVATHRYACYVFEPQGELPGFVAQIYFEQFTADSVSFDYVVWEWPS
jgi:hypothetical protein